MFEGQTPCLAGSAAEGRVTPVFGGCLCLPLSLPCLASDQCAARLALFNKVSDSDMCILPAPLRIHHIEDSQCDPTQSPLSMLAPMTKALKGLVQVIIAIVTSQ